MLRSLLLLQAAAAPPPAAPPSAGPPDLRIATRSLDCPSPAAEGEVVVCASRQAKDPNRLEPLPPAQEDPQLRFRLGSATVAPGVNSDRFGTAAPTVRVTIPF
jgi:hypothetical protein